MEDEKLEKVEESISEIVENLKIAVKEMITQADWMDDATKKVSEVKIENMVVRVGLPENILDEAAIEINDLRASFEMNIEKESFYESTRNINTVFGTNPRLRPIDSRNDEVGKLMLSFRADYMPDNNTITLPIVLLQHFFKDDRPIYNNYGEIGSVIARKMIRAIMELSEWTAETRVNFLEKAQCVVELYGNFTDRVTEYPLEARRTLTENIIDNGSIDK